MFRSLVGASFDSLPRAVREVHSRDAEVLLRGRCDIERGASLFSRALAAATFLPPAGRDVPITVRISRSAGKEVWSREFGGRRMRSVLRARGALLEERLGAVTFRFALRNDAGTLRWDLAAVRAFGIALPIGWFRGVQAFESEVQGVYRFDVQASLPLAGPIVHYRGSLSPCGRETPMA